MATCRRGVAVTPLAVLVLLGQVADVLSTAAAITLGRGTEANALFSGLNRGMWLLLAVKLVVAAVAVSIALVRLTGVRRVACLVVMATVSWWAPAHNAAVLRAEAARLAAAYDNGHHGPCNTVVPNEAARSTLEMEGRAW